MKFPKRNKSIVKLLSYRNTTLEDAINKVQISKDNKKIVENVVKRRTKAGFQNEEDESNKKIFEKNW